MSEHRSGGNGRRSGMDSWSTQMDALGGFIRAQRQLAKLSLREMANLTSVSNAYLSQIERGLHQPSLKVLRSIADALDLSSEQLLGQAGWMFPGNGHRASGSRSTATVVDVAEADPAGSTGASSTEQAIRRDARLSPAQREALLGVYRSFVDGTDEA